VAALVGEADDLVLDAGAIARPARPDLAGVERRTVQVGPHGFMDLGGGCGQPAGDLFHVEPVGHEGERRGRLIPVRETSANKTAVWGHTSTRPFFFALVAAAGGPVLSGGP
jgi:hypothetical protein